MVPVIAVIRNRDSLPRGFRLSSQSFCVVSVIMIVPYFLAVRCSRMLSVQDLFEGVMFRSGFTPFSLRICRKLKCFKSWFGAPIFVRKCRIKVGTG